MSSWVLWLVAFIFVSKAVGRSENKVLLLSFDGFRWDYLHQFKTPNLDRLALEGVHAPLGVRPAFATKTFPNHYSMATGLYEESHGIISNKMYDVLFNATFTSKNNETRWWDGGQPIWTTATLQGLRVGVFAWPGSNVRLEGVWPYRYQPFDKTVPFEERMKTVVQWLSEGVQLAVGYFHEPDATGHRTGAMSLEINETVRRMDSVVGLLIDELKQAGIFEDTDILIVSDHGMTNVTAERLIVLSDYLDFDEHIQIMPEEGSLVSLLPKEGHLDVVYDSLHRAHPNMTVYRKEDIPERFHYKKHRRILPIVILADEGYIFQKRPSGPDARPIRPGEHGYDNDLPSMRPIFFARGPHFKAGHKVSETFESLNVYPLVCHLLGIKPAPNNGSFSAFEGLLRKQENFSLHTLLSLVLQTVTAAFRSWF